MGRKRGGGETERRMVQKCSKLMRGERIPYRELGYRSFHQLLEGEISSPSAQMTESALPSVLAGNIEIWKTMEGWAEKGRVKKP